MIKTIVADQDWIFAVPGTGPDARPIHAGRPHAVQLVGQRQVVGVLPTEVVAEGKVGRVRVYPYGGIRTALRDLTTARCDAFMKLGPVLDELVRSMPDVEVVQRGLTTEKIAIAVPTTDTSLQARINVAQAQLEENKTLPSIRQRWTGSPRLDQSGT